MVLIPGGEVRVGQPTPTERWHERARTVTLEPWCMDRFEHPNVEGQLPTHSVTWEEARQACEDLGKRLCTSDEWERACAGTEGRAYAYGDSYDPVRCNTPIQGTGPAGSIPFAPSGSFSGCVSPEGVADLNGSLSEWVSDPWDDFVEPFNSDPGSLADPLRWRTLRGGTMWSGTFYGQDCSSRHGHDMQRFRGDDDGFRCCADLRSPGGP